MLTEKPKFSMTYTSISDNAVDIYMLLDTDTGPMELTRITSITEFYLKYQSTTITTSYRIAEYLLKLGYALMIQRVRYLDNMPSVLISRLGTSYPRCNYEYTSLVGNYEVPSGNLNYAYKIRIPNTIDVSPDTGDYILFNVAISPVSPSIDTWYSLVLGPRIVDKPIKDALSTITISYTDIIGNSPTDDPPNIVADNLAKLIRTYIGYNAEVEYADNEYVLKVYTYYLVKSPISTFTTSIDDYMNYDIQCRYLWDTRLISIFSKYDSADSHIHVIIDELGFNYTQDNVRVTRYRLTVNKYNSDDSYIIYTESYDWVSNELPEDINFRINNSSNIISINMYNTEIPACTHKLGRILPYTESTSSDWCTTLGRSSGIKEGIYIDSGTNDLNYVNTLLSKSTYRNILITKYNPMVKYKRTSISVFSSDDIIIDDNEYPSYIAYLSLLANNSSEGTLDTYIRIKESGVPVLDDSLVVNSLIQDNYTTELVNPQGYYANSQISMDNLIPVVRLTNNMVNTISNAGIVTPNKLVSIFEDLNTSDLATQNEITLELQSYTLSDRKCIMNVAINIYDYFTSKFSIKVDVSM